MLEDFTLAKIKRLDAGAWFDAKHRSTRIPTFGETIDALRGKRGLFIEVKSPERYEGIERLIMATLTTRGLDKPWADPKTPVVIQSFSMKPQDFAGREDDAADSFRVRGEGCAAYAQPEALIQLKTFATGLSPGKGRGRTARRSDGAGEGHRPRYHALHVPRFSGQRVSGRHRRDAPLPEKLQVDG